MAKTRGDTPPSKKHLVRVQKAVEWRRNAKYDENWSKLVKLYGNQYEYEELSGFDDVIAPNMAFSTANILVPAIAVNYPKITVTARREEFAEQAATVEAVVNYEWRHHAVHDEFRLASKDFIVVGHGWLKTTWSYRQEEQLYTPEEWNNELMRAMQEVEDAKTQAVASGVEDTDFPEEEDIRRSVPKRRMVVVEDAPVVARVSPFDIFVDPDATSLSNARWIAERRYVPLEVARKDERWDRKQRALIKATAMSEAKKDVDVLSSDEKRSEEADFAIVWEYYDLLAGTVCTIAEGCDDYLRAPEKIPFAFGHPYLMMRNYDVPDKFYPLGDIEVIMPLQLELALTRTQMAADRKRYRRMYMVRESALGEKGMDDLQSPSDNVIISVEGNEPFSDVIAPVQTTPLPPEFYNQSGMIQGDIDLVSGVTEYQRGSVSETRRTATEAAMIQDSSNARSADKLATIELTIARVAENLIALIQQFLTTEQVAMVVGDEAAQQWVPYTRDTVQGEYNFMVEAGSTQPTNETFRRQSAMQMMDAMMPFIQAGVINAQALAEHVLRNGFGIKETSKFIMAPPPMMGPEGAAPPGGAPMPPAAPEGMMV